MCTLRGGSHAEKVCGLIRSTRIIFKLSECCMPNSLLIWNSWYSALLADFIDNKLPLEARNHVEAIIFTGFFFGPTRAISYSFIRFLDHIQRHTTVGRTPLDEWSARRRDLYLTTHNTHIRETFMPRGGIRTHNLSRRAAADLRLRPRGHWDRPLLK